MLFLLLLLSLPALLTSPVPDSQNDANTGLPAMLLLSAVNVEQIIHDGYSDELVNVYNFFNTQFRHLDVTETVGSTDALLNVLGNLASSTDVSEEIKSNIKIIAGYTRQEKPPRLFLVPFDPILLRRVGLTSTLNRVTTYINEHPDEVFFNYNHLDLKNPLLPFLILLTSRKVDETIKDNVKSLLPHLKASLEVPMSPRILIGRDETNESENDAILLNTKEQNGGVFARFEESPVSSLNSNTSNNNTNLLVLFDILEITEHVLMDILKTNLLDSQKKLLNTISEVHANFQQFREKMILYFGTSAMNYPKNDKLIPNEFRVKITDIVNNILKMIKDQIIHNIKILCDKKIPTFDFIPEELVENLNNRKMNDEIKRETIKLIVDNCNVSMLDRARFQVEKLVKNNNQKDYTESNIEFSKELEEDIENLINNQGVIPNDGIFERHLPEKVIYSLEKLGITERNNDHPVTAVAIPSDKDKRDEKLDLNQGLRQGIRNLVFKYMGRSVDTSRGREFEIPEEIKSLPINFEQIKNSGCFPNLIRLYEYMKSRSFDKVLSLQDNEDDKRYLLRNIIDMILRKDYISSEIKNDAKCVSSSVFVDSEIEDRMTSLESTDLNENFKDLPLNISRIILDGYAENLLRITKYLKSHYQDLLISVQTSETEKLRVFVEMMKNILKSDKVTGVLKNDVDLILRYSSIGSTDLKVKNGLYPLDLDKLISSGLSDNLERLIELCSRHLCEKILEAITDQEDRTQTFIQLLETIRSFSDTSELLKQDIDAILPYAVVINN